MSRWRRLIQYFLVMGPMFMLAGLGIEERTRTETFETKRYDDRTTNLVLSYQHPVRKVAILSHQESQFDFANRLRRVASEWCELSDLGVLRPIPSAFASDNMREGTKAEIADAAEYLLAHLVTSARKEHFAQRYGAAADDLLFAIKVAQILKYSDLNSVGVFCSWQRQALLELRGTVPRLQESDRRRVASQLRKLRQSDVPLTQIALRARRNFWQDDARRGIQRQEIEDVGRFVHVGDLMQMQNDPHTVKAALGQLLLAYREGALPSYVTEIRYAWMAQSLQLDELDEVVSGLSATVGR